VSRAEKELKAFRKVWVVPGQTVDVSLRIPVKDLAYYDVSTKKWVVEPGEYELLAGTSSRSILQRSKIHVN
jgi:beta-glucosidase